MSMLDPKFIEAVHYAIRAVIKQGSASIDADGMCKYRGPNGLKCAVGHLMDDSGAAFIKEYTPVPAALQTLRIKSIEHGIQYLPMLPDRIKGTEVELLRYLQAAHDTAAGDARTYPTKGAEHNFVQAFKARLKENFCHFPELLPPEVLS